MNKFIKILAFTLLPISTAAQAQVIPYSDVAGYKIARVASQGTCFAVTEGLSANKKPMVYTYYQRQTGQRWQVAGYSVDGTISGDTINIEVSIDGQQTLTRTTETREGDFMLPFESLAEVTAHEDLVKTGKTMTITLPDQNDSLPIDLERLRAAIASINTCLTSVN